MDAFIQSTRLTAVGETNAQCQVSFASGVPGMRISSDKPQRSRDKGKGGQRSKASLSWMTGPSLQG